MVEPSSDKPSSTLVRDYTLIALAALVIVFLLLVAVGPGLWSLLPVGIALLAILVRGSSGPPLFLLSLVFLTLVGGWLFGMPLAEQQDSDTFIDILLAMGVLTFFAAHFRLLTAANHGVPPDYRRRRRPRSHRVAGRWLLPMGSARRTTGEGISNELVQLLVSVPIFAIVAALLSVRLRLEEAPFRIPFLIYFWQFIVVLWAGTIVILIVYLFLAYLGRVKASREESLLFLQDQLWTETRGEQRRITRRLAQSRLRDQRKKEN